MPQPNTPTSTNDSNLPILPSSEISPSTNSATNPTSSPSHTTANPSNDMFNRSHAPSPSPAITDPTNQTFPTHPTICPRLILLDYDGTLTPLRLDASTALLTTEQLDLLRALSTQTNTSVWIISGRTKTSLLQALPSYPAIGLAAEHGAFIRPPNHPTFISLSAFECHVANAGQVSLIAAESAALAAEIETPVGEPENLEVEELPWKVKVERIFGALTVVVKGSTVELKDGGAVWHYRGNRADGEALLGGVLRVLGRRNGEERWGARIEEGKCNVEVRKMGVDKGEAVKVILGAWTGKICGEVKVGDEGLVLCLGDDRTDEDMFQAIRDFGIPWERNSSTKVRDGTRTPTDSKARYAVDCVEEVWEILEAYLVRQPGEEVESEDDTNSGTRED